jgi:uncharacterized membrane protein
LLKISKIMVHTIFLIIHITAGFTALFGGLIAAASGKGNRTHLLSGKWFVGAMYVVGISALIMTFIRPNLFLMLIALFSLYLTYSGRQAIVYFRLQKAYTPTWKDNAPVWLALTVSLFMLGWPISRMIIQGQFFVSVSLVFGAIMLSSSIQDIISLRKEENFTPRNRMWLIRHIGMISGAYIATLTAFLVTNIQLQPAWVVWLAPTFLGTFFIGRNTRIWKKKLRLNQAAQ